MSLRWPAVRQNRRSRWRSSQTPWHFVVRPPRERPIASASARSALENPPRASRRAVGRRYGYVTLFEFRA